MATISMLLVSAMISTGMAQGTTLYVYPSSIVLDVNSAFTINIKLDDVTGLWAFDFKLSWNKAILNCTDDNLNQTMDALWGTSNWYPAYNKTQRINNTIGVYQVAVTALDPASPFSGNTSLVTLYFKAISVGQSALNFVQHYLVNYTDLEPIPHTVNNGNVTVSTPSVGGELISEYRPGQASYIPFIELALVILIPTIITVTFFRRRKKQ